jgi:hypothetical protein
MSASCFAKSVSCDCTVDPTSVVNVTCSTFFPVFPFIMPFFDAGEGGVNVIFGVSGSAAKSLLLKGVKSSGVDFGESLYVIV